MTTMTVGELRAALNWLDDNLPIYAFDPVHEDEPVMEVRVADAWERTVRHHRTGEILSRHSKPRRVILV